MIFLMLHDFLWFPHCFCLFVSFYVFFTFIIFNDFMMFYAFFHPRHFCRHLSLSFGERSYSREPSSTSARLDDDYDAPRRIRDVPYRAGDIISK